MFERILDPFGFTQRRRAPDEIEAQWVAERDRLDAEWVAAYNLAKANAGWRGYGHMRPPRRVANVRAAAVVAKWVSFCVLVALALVGFVALCYLVAAR